LSDRLKPSEAAYRHYHSEEHRDEDDKSGFLALAGYTLGNVDRLLNDLRIQLLPLDAELFDQTDYGPKYRIRGMLIGPNGLLCMLYRSG